MGNQGWRRSHAWMPVISSVLLICVPAAASAGVASEIWHTGEIGSASSAGSSGGAVSQERLRWGWKALTFEKTPHGARRNLLDNAAFDRFVGPFARGPAAHRPIS
jgi:hypothetical protein